MTVEIITGDCRTALSARAPFDMLMVDAPYGDTSLSWDKRIVGVFDLINTLLKPCGSAWVFGSMRYFLEHGEQIKQAGLRYAQDIVWEKQNGSGFAADRFKRVHEHVVQLYRDGDAWGGIYNDVQRIPSWRADKVTGGPRGNAAHMGARNPTRYIDDGTRIARSVFFATNTKGTGIHSTEKPVALLDILIRTSCPPSGAVGDLFAGSGAAGVAARGAGRNYVGTEIDADMAAKARSRLSERLDLVTL